MNNMNKALTACVIIGAVVIWYKYKMPGALTGAIIGLEAILNRR